MSMSRLSVILASGTLALAGAAFAQGTPPTTAPANPATGAGQQSPSGGPMGTTGTTPQSSQSGATSSPQGSGSTASGSMSGSTGSDTMSSSGQGAPRPARADRN